MKAKFYLLLAIIFFLISTAATAQTPADQEFDGQTFQNISSPYTLGGITYTMASPSSGNTMSFTADGSPSGGIYSVYLGISNKLNPPYDYVLTYNVASDFISGYVGGPDDFRFASTDGSEFKLASMEADASLEGTPTTFTITGYKDGSPAPGATANIDFSVGGTYGSVTYNQYSVNGNFYNGGKLTFDNNWQDIDEVRFTSSDAVLAVDDFNFEPAIVLPVNLVEFNGKYQKEDNAVVLNWTTASEQNNAYFDLQRSLDGKNFTTIVKLDGHGTSAIAHHYQYTDYVNKLYADKVYYRLKQVDYDGKGSYHKIVMVKVKDQTASINLYPNPSNGVFNLAFYNPLSQQVVITVYNEKGQVVKRLLTDQPKATVDLHGETKGQYLFKLRFKDDSEKILKALLQ